MPRLPPRGVHRFPTQQPEPPEKQEAESESESEQETESDLETESEQGTESEQEAESEPEIFYPSLRDAIEVRGILRLGLVPEGLPTEIVDLIIDTAEYWPSVEAKLSGPTIVRQDADRELLRTPPLCLEKQEDSASPKILPHRGSHPCRKIIFNIWSQDQGWGGGPRNRNSRYDGSYSWFDAFIISADSAERESSEERPLEARIKPGEPYFIPTGNKLQSNVVARDEVEHHHIVWHHEDSTHADSPEAWDTELFQGRGRGTLDGSAVREMKIGDSVSVWARARFPGWSNHVERLSVRVYWSV
ncbi:hypothetical protein DTO280E4_3776 [Paecilomyces variotii]|nr:hypothetical protein DTO169E5_3132 [Paecilomyces variotii]KAJ9361738.1 hypothetical protein DTO280E4_3776 [Paecilomyces variotii]